MSLGGLLSDTTTRGSDRKSLRDNTRAQSVVIGSILVFGLIVLSYGIFQTTIIPSANEDIEVEHSQLVREQMGDLRNDIQRTGSSGSGSSTSIKVGVNYPPRAIFLNPGPTSGSLRSEGTTDGEVEIEISNAEAINSETSQYWSGDSRSYSTGAITYQPNYNIYQNAPDSITIENSLVYSSFDDSALLASDQGIVSGRDISLTTIDGEVSTSQVPGYSVDTKAVSPATTTVPVQTNGGNIEIEITTKLSEQTLVQEVFVSEFDDEPGDGDLCGDFADATDNADDRYVLDCEFESDYDEDGNDADDEFNSFTLILESGTTYNLEMAKVGVGAGASEEKAHYMTDVSGDNSGILDSSTQTLVVQVRDRYNNPVSGVEVPFSASSGEFVSTDSSTVTVTTNEDGKAVVNYDPDSLAPDVGSRTDTIEVGEAADSTFSLGGSTDMASVQFSVEVTDSGSNTDAQTLNPSGPVTADGFANTEAPTGSGDSLNCGSGGGGGGGGGDGSSEECIATVELTNNGGEDYEITGIRWSYFSIGVNPGTNFRGFPDDVEVTNPDTTACEEIGYQGDFAADGLFGTISDEETKTLVLNFQNDDGTHYGTVESDGFVITVRFSPDSGPDFTETYFVGPEYDPSLSDDVAADSC